MLFTQVGTRLSALKLSHGQATGFLIGSAVLWSLGGLLIKSVEWNALAIAGSRSAIAAVLFWLILGRVRFTWSRVQIGTAFAYAATVILFVLANKLTTAANAILLQYTAPVWVAIFGQRFLGERTRARDWITIAAVFVGMGLFFLDQLSTAGMLGNLVAIASGISFAWLAMLMRRQKHGSPMESVMLGNITAAVLCLPAYFAGPAPDGGDWLPLLVLGIFQIGLSYVLYSVAVKFVAALEIILVPVVEPILNPLWVMIFLGETPGQWAMVGGAVVLAAVTVRGLFSGRRPEEAVSPEGTKAA